jgi:hypothetical protein
MERYNENQLKTVRKIFKRGSGKRGIRKSNRGRG